MIRRVSFVVFLLLAAIPASATEISIENVLRLMNEYRASHQLPTLRVDERLQQAADDRMRDMEEQQYWAHEAPDGTSPFVWLRPRSYFYSNAAENLARGFETSEVLVASWMESPGHRANILGADFEDVGISIIEGYTTGRGVGKSIVVLFGAERKELQVTAK